MAHSQPPFVNWKKLKLNYLEKMNHENKSAFLLKVLLSNVSMKHNEIFYTKKEQFAFIYTLLRIVA